MGLIGFRVEDLGLIGLRVEDFGLIGFRVEDLGLIGFGVEDLGFNWSSGFRKSASSIHKTGLIHLEEGYISSVKARSSCSDSQQLRNPKPSNPQDQTRPHNCPNDGAGTCKYDVPSFSCRKFKPQTPNPLNPKPETRTLTKS